MTRYNVLLRDGQYPVIYFPDHTHVTSGAPWPGTPRVSGAILRDTEERYTAEGNGVVTVPMFEVVSNPEIRVEDLAKQPEGHLVGMAVAGLKVVSNLFEEYVARTCAEHERVHGSPPAVVTVLVRTGPSVLSADDPECRHGPTVGFSIFMNVGVLASSTAPEKASEWTPCGGLMKVNEPVPPTTTAEGFYDYLECDIGGQI